MEQEYRPINHSGASAAVNTVAGAAVGGLKAGLLTTLTWVAGLAMLGAVIASGLATGGGTFFAGLSSLLSSAALWGAVGGAIVGTMTWFVPAVIGTSVGAVRGGFRANDRVSNEQAAANAMQAQVEMYKAQASSPYMNSVTAEEMAALQARQRGNDGQRRHNHSEAVIASQQAAAQQQAVQG